MLGGQAIHQKDSLSRRQGFQGPAHRHLAGYEDIQIGNLLDRGLPHGPNPHLTLRQTSKNLFPFFWGQLFAVIQPGNPSATLVKPVRRRHHRPGQRSPSCLIQPRDGRTAGFR